MLMLIIFLCAKCFLQFRKTTNQSRGTARSDVKKPALQSRSGVGRTGSEGASKRRRGFELDFCTSLFAFIVEAVGLRKNSAEK